MRSSRLPPDFLADLEAVAQPSRSKVVGQSFLDDLLAVHDAARQATECPAVSDADLRLLADRLLQWRSYTRQNVEALKSRLPQDDPLFCPISLLATMDYGRLETAHTRALAWLLNPDKEHGFGTKLLEALLSRVDGRPLPVEVESVESECLTSQPGTSNVSGRLDVLAKGCWITEGGKRDPWLVLIEAKIDAGEGEDQISRYEQWVESHGANRDVYAVFLTPDGRSPETACLDWHALKFEELVAVFRTASDQLRDKPGYHFLRFYLAGVLRDVCEWPVPIRLDGRDLYSIASYIRQSLGLLLALQWPKSDNASCSTSSIRRRWIVCTGSPARAAKNLTPTGSGIRTRSCP